MEPKYSILYYRQNLQSKWSEISKYLRRGTKVFWFGSDEDRELLKREFGTFMKGFFLQSFTCETVENFSNYAPLEIIDGGGEENRGAEVRLLQYLENAIPAFNVAQYRVEHCAQDANIVVKASAGTGKTTVMIDRILYLKHMTPDLDMSQIYMITFTNEATNQMNDRLQEVLLKKYSLTKEQKYLYWLEQQSQMHISTIDSLAYDLFRRFGTGVGFGRDLAIQQLEKERKDIIKDILSDNLSDRKTIESQIGMSYSSACKLIDKYWQELTRKGYTISEVLNMNWGKEVSSDVARLFQNVIRAVLEKFESQYSELKLNNNAISINDLFFDFGHYLLDKKIVCDGLDMKYLFVDEFQDTDATQIRTFADLAQTIEAKLFAVGDIKQSIYGFKGATDAAFDILEEQMDGKLVYFNLLNNYRTAGNIMSAMEDYFYAWDREGLLKYEQSVRPFNKDEGSITMFPLTSTAEKNEQIIEMIDKALYDLELDIKSGRKEVNAKSKVAVLVRGNNKAMEIAELCRADDKVVVLTSDRPFYLSDAVRDFYAMISSYVFPGQPIYTYNYLMSSYADFNGVLDVAEMERLQGNDRKLRKYLNEFLKDTSWYEYQKEFRLRPVLSVVKEMVERGNIVQHYVALDKAKLFAENMTEAKRNKQAYVDSKQYQANLDKLMDILQQRMDTEFVTLYDLYVFLSLMIATNRVDMEPDIETVDDYTSVYVMTVHKSKGLEFDTVVMPAMSASIVPREQTTIMVEDNKVGWIYKIGETRKMYNGWYNHLRKNQVEKGRAEETRLLYVGMTRAVNHLYMLVDNWDFHESWSSLIRKVGLRDV
ncbi:MAG: ATP-dependent helicase [Lachnospiraceae bacterium]|nr:ATP-dependent helicase [Lachnospiraceae bacterium]